MALEKWTAIASIGLFAMFAGEMITVYNFMTDIPADFQFGVEFEPNSKILQFISIGIAPASILAALSFILSKRYGSKQIGMMIIVGGIILLGGMIYCYGLLDRLVDSYKTDTVMISPLIFIGVSIPVIFAGIILIKMRRPRPKKEYF